MSPHPTQVVTDMGLGQTPRHPFTHPLGACPPTHARATCSQPHR
jgi:hypothetical protein